MQHAAKPLSLSALFLSLAMPAQTTVLSAPPGGTARAMEPWRSTLCAGPDGALWLLAFADDTTPNGQHLELWRSSDSGATWAAVADTPTVGDGRGAIVPGSGCDSLHVAWYAYDGGSFANVYYQEFDTATLQWTGPPQLLLAGTNANDQYYATDIAVTERGAIGIAFHVHRTPTVAGLTAWCAGLFVKRPADAAFQGPFRCNTDTYGLYASLQALGDSFHMAFRTNTGGYGIRYRAFDTATLSFVTPADVQVYAQQATNSSVLAADADGNLYILFSRGGTVAGAGELRLGYAPAGNYGAWTTQLVTADPDLLGGNITHTHFGLARGEGNTIWAVYSKRTAEQHQHLYTTIFAGGVATAPEIQILPGAEADSFTVVNCLRTRANHTDLLVALGGTPASVPGGRVLFLPGATLARTVAFGASCQGALADLPRLVSTSLPRTGTAYGMRAERLPANAFGLLFGGTQCQRPPIVLDGLGMPGCAVFTNVAGSVGFFADAAGQAVFTLPLGSNPPYANLPIHFAVLALAPAANPGGAITTNALMTWVR
jgi:hypothetical protein